MLRFLTKDQQFVFTDSSGHQVDPNNLHPYSTYDVYVVVENTLTNPADPSDPGHQLQNNVKVKVWHSSTFLIGFPNATDGVVQPLPVTVPPEYPTGTPGTETVHFQITVPAWGHGCIVAQLQPNGPSIGQNITVDNANAGEVKPNSIFIQGRSMAERWRLKLTETVNGSPVPASQSWHPVLVAPPGIASSIPGANMLDIDLPANYFGAALVNVKPPMGASGTHRFQVEGFVDGPAFTTSMGMVWFDLTAVQTAPLPKPDPYVISGYTSPDIYLYRSNGSLVPMGSGLVADTDYGLGVRVHNDSSTPAVNTLVRFWEIPNGTTALGTLLDVKTVTIPPYSSVVVRSSKPFRSAPLNGHRCAGVTIYNPSSALATVDATDATATRPTKLEGQPDCHAWRNTDSKIIKIHIPWNFYYEVGPVPPHPGDPVSHISIEATVVQIPHDFDQTGEAGRLAPMVKALGHGSEYPLHFVPALRKTLPSVDMKLKVTPVKAVRGAVADGNKLTMPAGQYTVEGITPKDAKSGDRYLLTVSAKYPDRVVQFFETLVVE